MILVWLIGLFVLIAICKEGEAAGYFFNTYQAIVGIYMVFRIHTKMHGRRSNNMSMARSREPFEFTPLDHKANDPRILSKYPIDGPDPRETRTSQSRQPE